MRRGGRGRDVINEWEEIIYVMGGEIENEIKQLRPHLPNSISLLVTDS